MQNAHDTLKLIADLRAAGFGLAADATLRLLTEQCVAALCAFFGQRAEMPSWGLLRARAHGKCACCGSRIVPGMPIAWHGETRTLLGSGCYHHLNRRAFEKRGPAAAFKSVRIRFTPQADTRGNVHCAWQ
jgi:hypothetical protein